MGKPEKFKEKYLIIAEIFPNSEKWALSSKQNKLANGVSVNSAKNYAYWSWVD